MSEQYLKYNENTGKRKTTVILLICGAVTIVLAVVAVILIVFFRGGNKKMVVGADISTDSITEFYYTYSSSTYPPEYQRYHFYIDDGEYMFYHEKREGDHFPLTKNDITLSGSIKLSQEELREFFGYVSSGTVQKREEAVESGGKGPWLYLYWNGDQSEYQAFTFDSVESRTSFENFCAELSNTAGM